MKTLEVSKHLYSDTPPTIARNRNEVFRTAKDHPFWMWLAIFVFKRIISLFEPDLNSFLNINNLSSDFIIHLFLFHHILHSLAPLIF